MILSVQNTIQMMKNYSNDEKTNQFIMNMQQQINDFFMTPC